MMMKIMHTYIIYDYTVTESVVCPRAHATTTWKTIMWAWQGVKLQQNTQNNKQTKK